MPCEPVREVVAGVDSPDPAAVLDPAATAAALRSAPLTLVQVRADARAGVLAGAAARVRTAHPALPVRAETLCGDPAAALAVRAAGASLLVLGHGGHRRGRRASGTVLRAVMARATVPVLICPDGAAGVPGPVVVGVDGAPGSEAALRFGFAEADLRHAPLTAMHLWPPLAGRPSSVGAAENAFLDLLASWSGKYPDVLVRLEVRHGLDAAIVLAAASRSASLVVVGAHAGPVLAALADRAACPVAAVPDTD